MADRPREILICSCEDTMPLDAAAVRRGCRGHPGYDSRQLCRAELDQFRKAASSGEPIIVGCTQEAPLFSEVGEGENADADIRFVNMRETAGWSTDAAARWTEDGRADRRGRPRRPRRCRSSA